MFFIYQLLDQNNNVVYIGQTNNPKRREHEHQRELKLQNKQLYKKMFIYGVVSLKMEVLMEETSRHRAELRETILICENLLNGVKIFNKTINSKNNHYGIKKTKTKKEKKS